MEDLEAIIHVQNKVIATLYKKIALKNKLIEFREFIQCVYFLVMEFFVC